MKIWSWGLASIICCLSAEAMQIEPVSPPEVEAVTISDSVDVILHVNADHPDADDNNTGDPDRPLRTLQGAARRAVANKQAFRSTRVVVHPGTYREAVELSTFTNYTGKPANDTPMIFEAAEAGTAVISGSDVLAEWNIDPATGHARHVWPHNWGVSPDPTRGQREIAPIVLRRETVFVNGERLRQVLTREDLEPGTYFVDEPADELVVSPPAGVRIDRALVEAGMREQLWKQEWENHVVLRGLVFQHAATPWNDIMAAVRIAGSRNVLIEDVEIRDNNGRGLYLVESEDLTLRQSRLNQNGWDGWGTWKIKRFLAEDSETSFNNWRGHLGGFYGWSVGNKLLTTHGLTLRRHRAQGNFARGLWLDLDNRDVVFDSVIVTDNLGDGLFIEANPGPILIRNSRFCENGGFGITAANSEQVTLTESVLCRNAAGEFEATGVDEGRPVTNFVTQQTRPLMLKDWTFTTNTIEGTTDADYLLTTTLDNDAWTLFVNTLHSDANTWTHPTRTRVFDILLFQLSVLKTNRAVSFEDWQDKTGQDRRSTFRPSSN